MSTIIFNILQKSFDKLIIFCYYALERGVDMITYKPLWHTLIEKGVKKMELVKLSGISSGTLAKLNNDKYVALDVLERICLALNCPIESVVEVLPNDLTEQAVAKMPHAESKGVSHD